MKNINKFELHEKIRKDAIKKIFQLPKNAGAKLLADSHAQLVIDIIFQTHLFLLTIKNPQNRDFFINLKTTSLVNELRNGVEKLQLTSTGQTMEYKRASVDEKLKDDDVFWEQIKDMLQDSISWNIDEKIIYDGFKIKIKMGFLAHPLKTMREQLEVTHAHNLKLLQDSSIGLTEKNLRENHRKAFQPMFDWAAIEDKKYQEIIYPSKSVLFLLLIAFFSYGFDLIPAMGLLITISATMGGGYLWGQHYPSLNKDTLPKNRGDQLGNLITQFNKQQGLKKVISTHPENQKTIYTKFTEKLPADYEIAEFETTNSTGITTNIKEKRSEKPKAQQPKARPIIEDISKRKNETTDIPEILKTHYNSQKFSRVTGQMSSPNIFAFFNSNALKNFKRENYEAYKKLKDIITKEPNFVGPEGAQGIKKLTPPIEQNGITYTHEAKAKGVSGAFRILATTQKVQVDEKKTLTVWNFENGGKAH